MLWAGCSTRSQRAGVFLVTVLSLVACREPAEKAAPATETVNIACTTLPQAALVYVAKDQGFFSREGTLVRLLPCASGKAALAALLSGKAEFATTGETPFVLAALDDKEIVAVATLATTNRDDAIIARWDRGIAHPGDLRGKRIGVSLATTRHYFLDTYLLLHGITPDQVLLVDTPQDQLRDRLKIGEVDAVAGWHTLALQLAEESPRSLTIFRDDYIHLQSYCFVTSRAYAAAHGETVRGLLRALLRAEAFVRAQPEAARAIVARAINIPSRYLDRMPEMFHLRVALDHSLVSSMDGQVRWLAGRQGHIAPTRIDVSDHLAPEFLTTVKPAAVRLYRVEKSRP